ncbi:hypothetical protein BHE90_017649 [Fusarium euwallaceae]|uniref:Uncharacterized protein n=1 Tax=Fusarium euwallaceae TaxID=1147111 RepID=A0A430KX56_9HYPO|nr:hypothetical protein BHE90_017649 [Fusarium euwallaceae]
MRNERVVGWDGGRESVIRVQSRKRVAWMVLVLSQSSKWAVTIVSMTKFIPETHTHFQIAEHGFNIY